MISFETIQSTKFKAMYCFCIVAFVTVVVVLGTAFSMFLKNKQENQIGGAWRLTFLCTTCPSKSTFDREREGVGRSFSRFSAKKLRNLFRRSSW